MGRSIPMAKLDTLVTTHMTERLFQPERLAMILSSLSSRRSEKADAVNGRVIDLQREVADADDKLKRLYRLIDREPSRRRHVELAASGDVECWHPIGDRDDELRTHDNHGD
jgi:hypothetical protein